MPGTDERVELARHLAREPRDPGRFQREEVAVDGPVTRRSVDGGEVGHRRSGAHESSLAGRPRTTGRAVTVPAAGLRVGPRVRQDTLDLLALTRFVLQLLHGRSTRTPPPDALAAETTRRRPLCRLPLSTSPPARRRSAATSFGLLLLHGPASTIGRQTSRLGVPEFPRLQRHWTINGRFLTQPLTGVQRYAREIVRALDAELAAGDRWADRISVDLAVPTDAPLPTDLRAIKARRHGTRRGHLWEQIDLPRAVDGGLLSLGNAGPVSVRRQIVCIHDTNSWDAPQSYSPAFRMLQRILLPVLGRRCAHVATVSDFSAGQIVRRGLCEQCKVAVIPNGHEHALRWTEVPARGLDGMVDRDTILIIGTPAPHKNVDLVLSLAPRLASVGLKVAVVGAADPKVYRALARGAAPNVRWLGRLGDAALTEALSSALCLAFPSLVEGFGLPPLEAMALGCPVVTTDRASLPEICSDAVLYAPPRNPEAWLRCFLQLHRSEPLRRQLIARGRERARLFSWRRSARLYLDLMSQVDGAVGGNPSPIHAPDLQTSTPRRTLQMREGSDTACSTPTRT